MAEIYRTNNPLEFDDVDGIIIDETAPAPSVQGVPANVAILVGRFARGPKNELVEPGSIGRLLEIYGKELTSGRKELFNKKFGRLRIIRCVASDAVKATLTHEAKIKFDAKYEGAYGNLLSVKIDSDNIAAVAASFDAAVAGVTGNVQLTADVAGSAGNSILLVGDGVKDLDTLVSEWNLANPGNTVTLDSANGADVPDNLAVMSLSGGSNAIDDSDGVTITIKDTSPNAVLGQEIYKGVKIAEITGATFGNSQLVDVTVLDALSGELGGLVETVLASGSDGTAADIDYEDAIAVAEQEQAGNVMWTDKYSSLIKGYLELHQNQAPDKMVIVSTDSPEDSLATALADVVNYRDVDGRIIYAFNGLQTTIAGASEWTSAAGWVASIISNTSPHIDPAYAANVEYTLGATDIKNKLNRGEYIQLKEAGIAGFEFDRDLGGFKLRSGIVTQILNSSKVTILRRRMADFLTESYARFLKNYQNAPNTQLKRNEVKGQLLAFDDSLIQTGILPSDDEVQSGNARLYDTESLNTNNSIAQGFFKLLIKRRIYSSMRFIVIQAEIGESVVVTEGEG